MVTDYSSWLAQLLDKLGQCGPEGTEALRFIKQRGTKLSLHDQPTGARWTAAGHIQVHPRYVELPPDDTYALSLIIHEVRHLQQGALTALSVHGELEAWQLQFGFIRSRNGRYSDDPRRNANLENLMQLSPNGERRALERARDLMQEYAGKAYRIDLLPLYPLPVEILFWITGKCYRPASKPSE